MKRLLVLLAAALFVSACGGGEPATVELTAADSGTSVTLEPGQQLQISLESNPSTGFRWNLVQEPDANVLILVSSTYVEPVTDDQVVGAPGTEVWTFEAAAAGTTSLELAYFRSFEPENVGGTFSLNAEVT
jgi:inhibitor of cysteine peptidase